MLHKVKSNAILFTTYPRTQNIHVFDFEKVRKETHSGEDTTNGRNLRMEMEFLSQTETPIKDDKGTPINGPDGNVLVLRRAANSANSVVFVFQYFTRMINISSKGIAVTE